MTVLLPPRNIVQVAYVVPNVFEAVEQVCRTIGAGPFFVLENIELSHCLYRGEEAELDHTSAYGQAGDVMIEILQQNNTGPSAFRDMYGPEEHGLHHMATFSSDFDSEIKRYEDLGFEAANIATTSGGTRFAYIDTRYLFGHMTEFYEDDKGVRDFYAMVKQASEDWDGSDPIRVIG